ncbi:MAG: tRNA-I(6)A37 thiotransferase enzyme MiaB [uncultured bacterium]|nr:MAG: tRNA-I(6)A37 thiotransferase enzyme MiaB [uncultured bacterium]
MSKTFYIKTLGCQANIADSEAISGVLESLGYEAIKEPSGKNEDEILLKILPICDLFIVNSCSVRQKSEDKVYGLGKLLKKISSMPKPNKKPFVVLAGCMVGSVTGERQRYAFDILKKKTPWVDVYINPSQILSLPEILIQQGLTPQAVTERQKVDKQATDHAYINISTGCDNFCSYCVVPYARGKEVSRDEKELLAKITKLTQQGFTHITLCGQNVNSWGLSTSQKFNIRAGSNQKLPFAKLLRNIHEIEGIKKIDFISSNPFDFTKDLIEAVKLPKISNYLHIAIQSGNNEVLKKMNRRHTVEEFKELVSSLRSAKPDMELGTDIIVGFPGETREQFMDTVKLFEEIPFNVAFISIYSPRKGTTAEKLYPDDVDAKEKKWRHAYLTKVWRKSQKGKTQCRKLLQ